MFSSCARRLFAAQHHSAISVFIAILSIQLSVPAWFDGGLKAVESISMPRAQKPSATVAKHRERAAHGVELRAGDLKVQTIE